MIFSHVFGSTGLGTGLRFCAKVNVNPGFEKPLSVSLVGEHHGKK